MQCRYRFPIKGKIRLVQNVPIPVRGWIFEFGLEDGLIKDISVTVPLKDPNQWPVIQNNPTRDVEIEIKPNLVALPFVKRELQSLQGLLALFGLESINFDEMEVDWLPESEEEKDQLHIFTMGSKREQFPDKHFQPLFFDVLARCVIAADDAVEIEVPMNFYRRGALELQKDNYIAAIYNFYFILETIFGEGKFKEAAVMDSFKKSPELQQCVGRAISDPGPFITFNKKLKNQFDKSYGMMNVEEVLRKFVKLRGELHHHTKKLKKMWHPEYQHQFKLDAVVLQSVTFNITFMMAEKYFCDKAVIQAYEALRKEVSKR
jgi:hypothetical protein